MLSSLSAPSFGADTFAIASNKMQLKPATSLHSPQARFGIDVTDFNSPRTYEGFIVTAEAPEATEGGLGRVMRYIPEALNTHLDTDMRRVEPMFKDVKQDKGFKDTAIRIFVPDEKGQTQEFKLFQKVDKRYNTIVYAIDNERYFGQYKNIYFKPHEFPKLTDAQRDQKAIESASMFNKAAAAFLTKFENYNVNQMRGLRFNGTPFLEFVQNRVLEDSKTELARRENTDKPTAAKELPDHAELIPFHGKTDVLWANDWQTAEVFGMLPKNVYDPLRVFQIHNHLDYGFGLSDAAKKYGLQTTPDESKHYYSPLREGLDLADMAFANYNYAEHMTKGGLVGDAQAAGAVAEHLKNGTLKDIHHGIQDDYSPVTSEFLNGDYVRLKAKQNAPGPDGKPMPDTVTKEDLNDFKSKNKAVLQKELGLNEDPDASIFLWMNRFEPFQKGFHMVIDQLDTFLEDNPKAQFILYGGGATGLAKKQLDKLMADPSLKGRLVVKNSFQPQSKSVQALAGADFVMFSSTYEPYGLVQLEGMRMGTIPIATPVDGLRSSISDPEMNQQPSGYTNKEPVWKLPQTGLLSKWMNFVDYGNLLKKQYDPKTDEQRIAKKLGIYEEQMQEFNQNYTQALQRAMDLAKDPDKKLEVQLNAMQHVQDNHSWWTIAHRYQEHLVEGYQKKFGFPMPLKPAIDDNGNAIKDKVSPFFRKEQPEEKVAQSVGS